MEFFLFFYAEHLRPQNGTCERSMLTYRNRSASPETASDVAGRVTIASRSTYDVALSVVRNTALWIMKAPRNYNATGAVLVGDALESCIDTS